MQREGPPLPALMRRIAETPAEFLAEPRVAGRGEVDVVAVLHDLFELLGQAPSAAELARDLPLGDARGKHALALLSAWLFADEWFRAAQLDGGGLVEFFRQVPAELGQQVTVKKLLADPDRREELARLALARLGYRPAGESVAQAEDRLTSLSSSERQRVMKAAKVAEERARKIREELARKAAEESADKWTRE